MTSSYAESLGNYYQVEDDAQGAGLTSVESELIDFATGVGLIDADTQEALTGETLEAQVLSSRGDIRPLVITNDDTRPVVVDLTNDKQSEVEVSLLGIPRSETALNLFDTVNIYGVNDKEWSFGGGYTYNRDPSEWTNRPDPNGILYGNYLGHIANESAIRSYSYPPPVSFSFPFDDNSGRFPGGYTDGVMSGNWTSKRAFRYQPGRVTGFTMGVRMSTDTGTNGEVVEWGCKNDVGDGYFFRLERGFDLSIVRTSPDLGTLVVPREEWNGDQVRVDAGRTGWGLDLSRVTMFKIEFSWYGAVGAKFMAYVPAGNGEALWVALHYIRAENLFEKPSLRSAYLRMFTSTRSAAGATKPTFIYLYGSSVYIDGGDKGTVTLGTAANPTFKNISASPRSLMGLSIKGSINGVSNQKAVYPVSLTAYSSVPARIDLIFRGGGCGVQYGYGTGASISRGGSAVYSGVVASGNVFVINSGQFPDITAELSGSTTYVDGRRVKINGTDVWATHATAINSGLTAITTDRALPPLLSSVSLSRFDAYAVGDTTITTGAASGVIYANTDGGAYSRIGLWPQASGVYDSTKPVVWLQSVYPVRTISFLTGQFSGEISATTGSCSNNFTIATGTTSTITTSFLTGERSITVSGSPWPIAVVAELMDGATIRDVVIAEGDFGTPDSGATKAITTFTVSGVSQSAVAAGGTDYIAHKFEDALADPLSACIVDRQGSYTMPVDNRVATYFLGADETKFFDLNNVFGPDKMFITGPPGSQFNTGALFVMATARAGSGIAGATLNWEEQ
jgi:hypothetical protein